MIAKPTTTLGAKTMARPSAQNVRFSFLIYLSLFMFAFVFFVAEKVDRTPLQKIACAITGQQHAVAPSAEDIPEQYIAPEQDCLKTCVRSSACSEIPTDNDSSRRQCFSKCRASCKVDAAAAKRKRGSDSGSTELSKVLEGQVAMSKPQPKDNRAYQLSYFKDTLGSQKPAFLGLLKALSEVFEEHKIDYMIFGGTVISHCRHAGTLIPFDDDVDLLLAESDLDALQKGMRAWNTKANVGASRLGKLSWITDKDGGAPKTTGKVLKVFWENSPKAGWTKWHYPYLDVWTYVLKFNEKDEYPPRYTVDGRHCKGSFMYEGTEHFQCIAEPETGKEWCYHDDPDDWEDDSTWGYCVPLKTEAPAEHGAGMLPLKQPWNNMWAGAQVFVSQTTTWKGYAYPYEYLFPTQPIMFEGMKLRGPKEMAQYLTWEYGSEWREWCKVGDYDHKTETFKLRANKQRGLPVGVDNTARCKELAERHPSWKFSLGADLEERCPMTYTALPEHVTEMTKVRKCEPGDTQRMKDARTLLKSFHKLMEHAKIDYWITYGTALGQAVWGNGIPYDTDVDVAIQMKDAKLLWKLQGQPETIKRTFKGVLVVHPDWEKPNWADRSYYRASGINFVAPIARFYDLRKEVHLDIWGEPTHTDLPQQIPDGFIAQQHENYDYVIRPLKWVFPVRPCLFDGVKVNCQNQQALALRFEYGHTFREPHKTCIDGHWMDTARCLGQCGTEVKHNGRDWCWTNKNSWKWKYCNAVFEKQLVAMDEDRKLLLTPCLEPCGGEDKHKGRDWCYTSQTGAWEYCNVAKKSQPHKKTSGNSIEKTKKSIGVPTKGTTTEHKKTVVEGAAIGATESGDEAFRPFIPQKTIECERGTKTCPLDWRWLVPVKDSSEYDVVWKEMNARQKALHTAFVAGYTALTNLKLPFHLDSGTALGAVREGNFMPHDKDIDVAVFQWDLKILDKHSVANIEAEFAKHGLKSKILWIYEKMQTPTEFQFTHTKTGINFDIIIQGAQNSSDFQIGKKAAIWQSKILAGQKELYVTYAFGPPCRKFKSEVCGYWYKPFKPTAMQFFGRTVFVPPVEYFIAQYGRDFAKPKDFTYSQGLLGGYTNFCKLNHIRIFRFVPPSSAKTTKGVPASDWKKELQSIRYDRYSAEYGEPGGLNFVMDQESSAKKKVKQEHKKKTTV